MSRKVKMIGLRPAKMIGMSEDMAILIDVENTRLLTTVTEDENGNSLWREFEIFVEYDNFIICKDVVDGKYYYHAMDATTGGVGFWQHVEIVGMIPENIGLRVNDDIFCKLDLIDYDYSGEAIDSCDYYYFEVVCKSNIEEANQVIKKFNYDTITETFFEIV